MGNSEQTPRLKKSFRQFLEETRKEIVVTFGRFNPPTIGHQKLIEKVASLAKNDQYRVYVSQTSDAKKNPLSYEEKIAFMRKMFPKHGRNIILDKGIKTFFDALVQLDKQGFTKVVFVVGSDRVASFAKLLDQYHGKPLQNGEKYEFADGLSVVSAGERDPDSDDAVEGMSASKARAAAAANDFAEFSSSAPDKFTGKKNLFNAVRKGLGLNESYNPRLHIKLPEVSDARLKFVNGELCKVGDLITISECVGTYTVNRLGPNFVEARNNDTNELKRVWVEKISLIK